jgi:hypothetical protein
VIYNDYYISIPFTQWELYYKINRDLLLDLTRDREGLQEPLSMVPLYFVSSVSVIVSYKLIYLP